MKKGYVYLMANKNNTVIYTGVTGNLQKRVFEHKEGLTAGFTEKYNVKKLVYYQEFSDILDAIEKEKKIKAGSRKKKIDLIESVNPDWKDLFDDL